MDSDTVAESDMSLKSRSFLHRVNDRVRKIQNQSSKDETQDSNKHSVIWRMFMSSTLEASVFMGKNYLEHLHSIKNIGKDLTMKQMFDISEKLIAKQSDEMSENPQSNTDWEDKLTWFKSSSQHRALDTIDGKPMGIRVEYFHRIHHIAALQQSPRLPVKNERSARRIHRRDHLHVDVQRHLMKI